MFAGVLLFVASLGFYAIKEKVFIPKTKKKIIKFLKLIPQELKKNSNLKFYLIIINILGLSFSLLPFFILLAKKNFGLNSEMIGNFLLFKVIGMFSIGILIFFFGKKFNYKRLLYITAILGASLPIMALFLIEYEVFFKIIFIFSGIFFSVYRVTMDGILLEISTDENRAEYAGIAGAGNILTVVFPLIAGFLIKFIGFTPVFITISIILFLSIFLIRKMNCKQ